MGGGVEAGEIEVAFDALLRLKGQTTDFTESGTSMEIEKQKVEEDKPGDMVGMKVKERVRENDIVYKVVE